MWKVTTMTGAAGDGAYVGVAATQRIGLINTAFRANASFALDKKDAEIDDGTLLFAEISKTPPHGDDVVYLNAFWGIDKLFRGGPGCDGRRAARADWDLVRRCRPWRLWRGPGESGR